MKMKTVACAMAVALLAGTSSFAVPATAQNAPMAPSHARKLFMSAGGAYNAGLRRGRADSFGTAYLRGFRDGRSRVADGGRAYIVNPYAGYSARSYDREAEYGTAGYWPFEGDPGYWTSRYSYDSNAAYRTADYSYDDGHYPYYDEARRQAYGRYDGGYAPSGLLNVAAAPLVTAQYSIRPATFWSYCAARYRSFDQASGTFLAYDGNRYACQ